MVSDIVVASWKGYPKKQILAKSSDLEKKLHAKNRKKRDFGGFGSPCRNIGGFGALQKYFFNPPPP
jgi:hypothetical protein